MDSDELDNSEKKKKQYERVLEHIWERENYTHGTVWRAMNFFSILVSGLISVSLAVLSFNGYAALGVDTLAIVFVFLGHYVVKTEGRYFQEYRHERFLVQKELGYEKLDILYDSGEFQGMKKTRAEYLREYVDRPTGVRYAFRVVSLIQAELCVLIFGALSFRIATQFLDWSTLNLVQILTMSFMLIVLFIVVQYWFMWEIKSLCKKLVRAVYNRFIDFLED